MSGKAKHQEIAKHIDWNRLHTFLVVGEAGTFTRAGRKLNLSQSAVSRQISILEGELNTPLFYRTSQGLVFTEAGEDFFNTVKSISDKLAMGLARVNERREKPEGPLRITTTVAFGSAWLSSRMTEFHRIYPDIAVSLILADNIELDLLHRQADCAIRFRKQTEPTLVQRYLMTVQYHLYGSRTYLAKRGTPKKPEDLDGHDLIVYGDDAAVPIADMNSVLTIGRDAHARPRAPALCVNSVYGIFRAVDSGLGIGALPHYVAEEDPEIVQILPEFSGPTFEVYFVYPEELRHSKRIDALKSFLIEQSKGERKRQPRKRSVEPRAEEALG
jgi:DNA-binding transcriptional LysR family regulator